MKKLSRILTACGNAMGRMWNLYKNCFKSRPWYIKTLSAFATVIVIFLLYLGAVDLNLFWLFGKSPGWAEVSKHQTPEASELYSADGVLLGKYFNENRTPVEYEEVNPVFGKALIDTEDERFYSHWGIDPLGMLGAAKDAATGAGARGASRRRAYGGWRSRLPCPSAGWRCRRNARERRPCQAGTRRHARACRRESRRAAWRCPA